MRRVWLVLIVGALAGLAGPAQGQTSTGVLIAIGVNAKVVSQADIPVQAKGELDVSFHGDAAAGCAAYGLCAYAGTIVVRPVRGDLTIETVRLGKRIQHEVFLGLSTGDTGYSTYARVQRSAPGGQGGTCADVQGTTFGLPTGLVTHGGSLAIRLLAAHGSLLQTRCAGPLDGDLAGVSPVARISLARALGGRTTLDLSGARSFAVHGFAGTIRSNIVLRLGKPSEQSASFPAGIKTQQTRTVLERLSLVRLDGGLSASVSGTTDPVVCKLLDTCGLAGTLTLEPVRRAVTAELTATGPASRPYRDFATALGLERGGRTRGIQAFGLVTVAGAVRAEISQFGSTCADTGGTGVVLATIGPLGPGLGGGGLGAGWRTQCPGPSFEQSLAGVSTSLEPGALGHPVFTLNLRGGAPFTDDGYVISPQGQMSVVLRRGKVTSRVDTEPAP